MTIKWCAFTGAIMALFVALTFNHKGAVVDPPGVTTRWWDGTLAKVEQKHSNGKLASRTIYGEDGRTVNAHEEWNYDGKLVISKIRREDGLVEEKNFGWDGETLTRYVLWNGDGRTFRISREYHPNGKLFTEVINTEDGLIADERRTFSSNGQLLQEFQILDNADQETVDYQDGRPVKRHLFKANGDDETTLFHANGKPRTRNVVIRLTGAQVSEQFDQSGTIQWSRHVDGPRTTTSVFDDGKLKVRQNYVDWGRLESVEEYSTETGHVTRKLVLSSRYTVSRLHLFRGDGTLRLIKHLDADGKVVREIGYDAAGANQVSEKEGGEPETIDPRLLQDASFLIRGGAQ